MAKSMDSSDEKLNFIVHQIKQEFIRAANLHGPMKTFHGGYGIIKEEFDELWDDIKQSKGDKTPEKMIFEMYEEAIQVGAMAVRFIYDLIKKSPEDIKKHYEKILLFNYKDSFEIS